MTQATYSILFDGTLAEGASLSAVTARLAVLFKQPSEKMAYLFSGRTIVIKRDISREVAERYRRAFLKAGAVCRVQESGKQRSAPAIPAPVAVAPGTAARAAEVPVESRARAKREPPAALSVQSLPGFFRGAIEPVPMTLGYRMGLMGVATAMLVLPAIYLLLTVAAAYATYWWATHGWAMMLDSATYIRAIMYSAPLAVSTILFLFMLKPLFASSPRDRLSLTLSLGDEPLFFAFVHHICDLVGAPRPKFIHVDSQVNAAAGFFRGRHGIARNELTLTVGMPVFAGMSTRQLAGVLAHEFGHFTQGAGMRTTAYKLACPISTGISVLILPPPNGSIR